MSSASTITRGGEGFDWRGALFQEYMAGQLSAHMTLMYWLKYESDVDAIQATLSAMLQRHLPSGEREAFQALARLLDDNRAGCDRIAGMLSSGMDTDATAATVDAGLEFSRRLFDWSVGQSPEASVALYSLGNPQILEAATAEITAQFARMGLVTRSSNVLDIGCGTGRLEYALAPAVRSITGVDLSAGMVKAAQERCASFPNVSILLSTGRDLAPFGDASFDLVFAVDSFPYIVQSGGNLAESQFAEVHRVLKRQGSFVILEYSYRGDLEQDCADVTLLADRAGFGVSALGERPFCLWDGAMYHLLRR